MIFRRCLVQCLQAAFIAQAAGLAMSGKPGMMVKSYPRDVLQNIVSWDEHSIYVHGERVFFYSGEFHPFRIPVPGLWLDIFQKIRSMGYTGCSFYVDWALLEGKPGSFSAEGVFNLKPFFDAAKEAGVYLLARPGPYINAEVAGGGFPGWLQQVSGRLRTLDQSYLEATQNYVTSIGKIIADAQITNGGPVILFQPENEYFQCTNISPCPDPTYMAYVEKQFRDANILVPFIVNDNNRGNFAPGKPAATDLYGFDQYPLGFNCKDPYTWPSSALPLNWRSSHLQNSPATPFALVEFQGGSFDPWGGVGWDKCTALLGPEFERVFYKNSFAAGATFMNLYMTYGGSNWGNLGYPQGYSSYDYGATIAEDRTIAREKYSEAKLEANFVNASPDLLTATPGNLTTNTYASTSSISVTPLFGNGSSSNFYVVRQSDFTSQDTVPYNFTAPTSKGNITIPALGGSLSLVGRDSKWHVTDYKLGSINLLYSSAEIFTWKSYGSRTVLVVYGGPGERHELAISNGGKADVAGQDIKESVMNGATVLNWQTSSSPRLVNMANGLSIYILDRQSAYNYWVLKLPDKNGRYGPDTSASTVVVKAGYLMRTANVVGPLLYLTGDFNRTTSIEVIGGAPRPLFGLFINGRPTRFTQDFHGVVKAEVEFTPPRLNIPALSRLQWKYVDSLPEIQPLYDDSKWPLANLTHTKNSKVNNTTPTSLFAGDYGFTTGTLLYRGHFQANGNESSFFVSTQGGNAFASSVWINTTFLGSFAGGGTTSSNNSTYTLPTLHSSKEYVITVVVDQSGLEENYNVGLDLLKTPRGILDYGLSGHATTDVTWKITGNLGGWDYQDQIRGPLNEGGLWAERQGYHLPGAPTRSWSSISPFDGSSSAGIGFYAAELDLNLPSGYDIPMSITFTQASASPSRVQLYVNGYQFGKYLNTIGPQTSFPVPQGIWDYHGKNYIAFSLWALQSTGASIKDVQLTVNGTILTGYGQVPMAPIGYWSRRAGAY